MQLIEVGPAHTNGDAIAYLPAERTVFTGDILFIGGHPIVSGRAASATGSPLATGSCARCRVIVPGHGPITDKTARGGLRAYFDCLTREAKTRFDAGMGVRSGLRHSTSSRSTAGFHPERIIVNVNTLYKEFGAVDGLTMTELRGAMSEIPQSAAGEGCARPRRPFALSLPRFRQREEQGSRTCSNRTKPTTSTARAGSPPPMRPAAISRSRTCRSACSASPAASRMAGWRSATTFSTCGRHSTPDCSRPRSRGGAICRGRRAQCIPGLAGNSCACALRQRVPTLLRDGGAHSDKARAAAEQLTGADGAGARAPAGIDRRFYRFPNLGYHSEHGGRRARRDNPVPPVIHYVPMAYHSRASSVRVCTKHPATPRPVHERQ